MTSLNSLLHDIVDRVFHYSDAADAHATIDAEVPAPPEPEVPATPPDPRDARIAELEAQIAGQTTQPPTVS